MLNKALIILIFLITELSRKVGLIKVVEVY